MVQIIYDAEHLVPPVGEQTVANVSEYAGAYARLLAALQNNQDFRLVVRHQAVYQWLKNLAARYPQGVFVFETLDARQALAQKWGLAIPGEVSNAEIQASGLLQLDLHAQPGQNFADLLMAYFFAPLLSAKTFPFTQLPQLFDAVDLQTWQANRAVPLLARLLRQRFEAWKNQARTSEQRQFIEWFAANLPELHTLLMQFRVLRHYPALGETLLSETYPILSALKLGLEDLSIEESRIPAVISQVTYFLNAIAPQSAQELSLQVGRVSGLLWVEYEWFEKHLRDHPEWLSLELLADLETRFEALGPRLPGLLANLRALIRPPRPQAPDPNWDAEQMLDWATRDYLPYQAWCSAREQFDPDLYRLGDQFSAWLMAHWNDLRANSGRMVFNILPKLAPQLNDPGRIHLILVVDNLGWSFAETLRDLFQAKGFFLSSAEPYLAMLPTETEISKKCLLSGEVGYTQIDDTSYKKILEKGWVPYFNDNAFRYISDIGKLSQVSSLDARVYVVNYLAVDKILHKSADEIGMPHREHIQHLLAKLVDNASAFIARYKLDDCICIHIVSDHGSTQIPASLTNDLDSDFFKQAGFEDRSHRFLSVSDARFATLADNLKLDCFFLPANDFLLPANVLCARRANRFLPTDKDIFVHGGLLPEEIIVPYMAFEPATATLKNLDVLLKKSIFRYRPETVELEIGNPNGAAVEQVQVSTLNGNIEWQSDPLPVINANRNTIVRASARFKPTNIAEEQTFISLRIRFRARGQAHTFDVKLPITMRKVVEATSAGIFDD